MALAKVCGFQLNQPKYSGVPGQPGYTEDVAGLENAIEATQKFVLPNNFDVRSENMLCH